jgi:hypothetical protein
VVLSLATLLVAAMAGAVSQAGTRAPNTLSAEEIAAGWVLLWDGESTYGWERHGGADWTIEGGTLRADAGTDGWLRHATPFANFVLVVEFRMNTPETDSGIFLRAASEGDPTRTGYQVNINERNLDFPTASIVGRFKATAGKVKPKEWHRYVITADGDHLTVELDGRKVLDARDRSASSGSIGLQFVKGGDIEFRSVALRPLGLERLFNGKDLTGWTKVERPRARSAPEWSVRDGAIHVEKGPGQLETTAAFGDFVLQLEARTNPAEPGRHPNSGVFFRGEAGKAWTGFEAQIRNEFKEEDRSRAVDFGTGGLYRLAAARRVVSSDGEFFTLTIVAVGHHVATWVNGIEVARFDDKRPEAKEAAKTGPIGLQAHDPTTNLDFRNLRIAAVPASPR